MGERTGDCLGFEALGVGTDLTTVQGLASLPVDGFGNRVPAKAIIQCALTADAGKGAVDVRWKGNGDVPTATDGMQLAAGAVIEVDSGLANLKFIGVAANAKLLISYYAPGCSTRYAPTGSGGSGGGGGSGTVTTVSIATANGFSGSVANPTTTPAITIVPDATIVKTTATQSLTNKTTTTQAALDNSTKLASTAYVDLAVLAAISGLDVKPDVAYAATVALPANTYANGTAGVGATLTGNANGPLIVDSVTILVGQIGQRILVAGEAAQANNGWYTITQQGLVAVSPYILTRATESDQAAEIGAGYITGVVAPNTVVPGSANNGKLFVSVAATPFTVGTTALTFSGVGNTYSAGTGLGLSGTTFSIDTAVAVDKTTAQTLSNKTLASPVNTGQASFVTVGYASVNAIGNSGATKTIDWGAGGNVQSITLNNNCTFTFTAPAKPGSFRLYVTQDGTGGRVITWPAIKSSGAVTPVATTTAGATDIFTIEYDGTNYYVALALPDVR